jgi:serine/threonine protein kinase
VSDLRLYQCRIENRYDILDCLGRGSYAEIYVARDATTVTAGQAPQLVVIKALNTQLQGLPDPDLERTLIENFNNEATALDRVRHPNIISRLGDGTARDLAGRAFRYILLEYMPGGDLSAICRNHPLPIEHAMYYLQQVCAGLSHAHTCGVIHRDIKPQNLLLTADRQTIKIADFGVAKIKMIEDAAGTITRVGTDVYAPPEHHPLLAMATRQDSASLIRSLEPVGLLPAADIYSLAKTVYMILTGETPRRFSGQPITEFPASFGDKSWSSPVLEVLRRATQTSVSARHQTIGEFWTELSAAAQGRSPAVSVFEKIQPKDSNDNGQHQTEADKTETGKITLVSNGSSASAQNQINQAQSPTRGSNEQADQVVLGQTNHQPKADLSRSRIMVSVADAHQTPESQISQLPHGPQNIATNPVVVAQQEIRLRKQSRFNNRVARWLVVLLIITSFFGMLLATRYYVQRIRNQPAAAQNNSPIGREFITTTDVNLRTEPNAGSVQNIIAEVKRDSRVRVREVRGDWYRVEVAESRIQNRRLEFEGTGWLRSNNLRPE